MSKILIIEDDRNILSLEEDYLNAAGCSTISATDGKIGLEKALSLDIDLVILDLMLPSLDGFEICKGIREKKDIPIIVVSARKEDFDKINLLGIGADDYVVKPFSPSELVARAKAHLSRYNRLTGAEKNNAETVTSGPLTINKKARRMFINSKELTFTNKEFDLLDYLAENPNVVFTKDELFNTIWESDPMGETSTITVHINRIRDKIKELGESSDFIETVWGSGYRFKD
ncbi:MAG: DNA-binding response regulator [Escherichia coli]|nr:MAG: DNA-binding response regulator [Escherichia coli]